MSKAHHEEQFDRQTSIRFFDCTSLPIEPWANGGGTTRTIARGRNGEWRVSLAELVSSAKFSQFAGFDRTMTLLDEGSVNLHAQDGMLIACADQPVHFAGDLHVWVGQPAVPVNVLNVMTRRGRYHSRVNVMTGSSRIASATAQILLCVSGTWTVESAVMRRISLQPLAGIGLNGLHDDIDLKPNGPDARLVSVAIDSIAA
jgi:environmental stress-induced protein Ves